MRGFSAGHVARTSAASTCIKFPDANCAHDAEEPADGAGPNETTPERLPTMKIVVIAAASVLLCLSAAGALAQGASASQSASPGSSSSSSSSSSSAAPSQANPSRDNAQGSDDVGVIELDVITAGWSARKDIIGKPVYNEQNQRIGKIDDIIITPDNAVSFAIIGAGGFLGIGKHDVVIPVDHIESVDNRYVIPGATKAALKALPAFKYKRGTQ
jgi:sporulation protein YlmC with PRC-barrel domain